MLLYPSFRLKENDMGARRDKINEDKKNRKKAAMLKPGNESNYAKKSKWLARASKALGWRLFGFMVPSPKPWK